jgi:hypothetical protein
MNIKICGQSTKTNYQNTGSCAGAVMYDEHELRDKIYEKFGLSPEQVGFFDMDGNRVTGAEVIDKIDRLSHSHLGKSDAKFYVLMVSPSDNEIAAMGSTLEEQLANGQQYIFDVLDAEASNFNREGVKDRHNLAAWAVPHIEKGKDGKMQIHWHIIQARKDVSNTYKLSPLTNHRNTQKGAVKGGFDRVTFDAECEKRFDARFGYKRGVQESFDYCLAQKKGTVEEKTEQTERLAAQNAPALEKAITDAINRRVARLAQEATERAIKQQQAQEEARKRDAARQETARKNTFWNNYHSLYKPMFAEANAICNSTFATYQDYKQRVGDCGQEISRLYNEAHEKQREMKTLQENIDRASSSKAIIKAVALAIGSCSPLLGLAVALIGSIVVDSERRVDIETKKKIRQEAKDIYSRIDALKEQQQALKQDKSDALKAYVEAKENRQELHDKVNELRKELDKPIEQPKPKLKFDFVAARQQNVGSVPKAQPSAPTHIAKAKVDIASLLLSAADRNSLELALLDKKIVLEPMRDRYKGVADFSVTLAAEGRTVNASSLVSTTQMRQMLNKWENLTGEIPAYKLEIQRENQKKLVDICAKMDAASPENAPRIPKSISFLPGGEIQITFTTRRGNTPTLKVDASGKLRFNGIILDINTGKYMQQPTQHQTPHHSQGESRGEGKGYGGHKR